MDSSKTGSLFHNAGVHSKIDIIEINDETIIECDSHRIC
jgi:hypothetical protein